MSLATVPTLDELAADPGKAAKLPLETATALLARCVVVHGVLVGRLIEASGPGTSPARAVEEDRLLTPEQAAALLGMAPRWLYRHAGSLPFTRRLSRKALRFSEAGLRRWLSVKRS
jgi:predicted DNA-binding transcriptional regulator AlpA